MSDEGGALYTMEHQAVSVHIHKTSRQCSCIEIKSGWTDKILTILWMLALTEESWLSMRSIISNMYIWFDVLLDALYNVSKMGINCWFPLCKHILRLCHMPHITLLGSGVAICHVNCKYNISKNYKEQLKQKNRWDQAESPGMCWLECLI